MLEYLLLNHIFYIEWKLNNSNYSLTNNRKENNMMNKFEDSSRQNIRYPRIINLEELQYREISEFSELKFCLIT